MRLCTSSKSSNDSNLLMSLINFATRGWGDPAFNLHSCVENWLKSGVDRKKVNIGLPFYGRSVSGAQGLNEPHSGADKTAWSIDEGGSFLMI